MITSEDVGMPVRTWADIHGKSRAETYNSFSRGYSKLPAPKSSKTHPLYHTYRGMIERCYSNTHTKFDRYGGRGIYVCARWFYSFENFVMDMGDKPSPKHSIDRIDNGGIYSPENCRWASKSEQVSNREYLGKVSPTLFFTPDGVFNSASVVGVWYGKSISTVSGWFSETTTRTKKPGFTKQKFVVGGDRII